MRTLWAILMAGFLLVGTEKTGLGENTEENEAKSLKEKKLVIKAIWMINLEDNSKTRKQLSENIRQNMRLQEGNAYSQSKLTDLIEIDVEEVFKIGNFILLDIQNREPEDTKDSYLIDLEVYYMAKNRNAKGLYKEGVLAQVGEQKIYLNQLVRKLKNEEIALKEQLLTSRIHKETFNKKISDTRKNYLDKEIVKAFCIEVYRQSPFQYPDYFFDGKERKVIREKYNGNRGALIQDLEGQGITYAEWRKKIREDAILSSVSEFLKSQGKTLSPEQIEAFYNLNVEEYLTEFQTGYKLPFFRSKKPELLEYTPSEFISGKDSYGNPVLLEKCANNTFVIDSILIKGNESVPDASIRRLLRLSPGENVNQEELFLSLIAISNLNLFSKVNCYFKGEDNQKNKRVVVECHEKSKVIK